MSLTGTRGGLRSALPIAIISLVDRLLAAPLHESWLRKSIVWSKEARNPPLHFTEPEQAVKNLQEFNPAGRPNKQKLKKGKVVTEKERKKEMHHNASFSFPTTCTPLPGGLPLAVTLC